MDNGKLETKNLQKLVYPYCGDKRKETVIGPAIGEDSCVLDMEGDLTVITTDPITGAQSDGAWLGIQVSCNDLAASGAEPVAVLLTILLQEGSNEEDLRGIMESAHKAVSELEIQVVGGHTEITQGLEQNIIMVTAIGRMVPEKLVSNKKIREGDQLVLTKGAGIEGTAIFCQDYPEQMGNVLGQEMLQQGREFSSKISVVNDARVASTVGVHSMHDVTEGGILGAAYEMAQGAGLGLTVHKEAVAISTVTQTVCRQLEIDPLKLISSGSLLIATDKAAEVVDALENENITATIIGEFNNEEKIQLESNGKMTPIEPPKGDELWAGKAKLDSQIAK